MAQRTFNRALPTLGAAGYNLFDQVVNLVGSPVAPNWSKGAQLVVQVPPQEFPDQATVLGYGFSFQGALFNIKSTLNGAVVPNFARLGKLYGGLLKNSGAGIGEGAFTQMPPDRTMIELLWDGRNDPPWPQALNANPSFGTQSLQVFKESLPQPVEIDTGDTLEVGLWLTPMLGQNVGVWIVGAQYSILYDDPNR